MLFGTYYWLIYRVITTVNTFTVSICIADLIEHWTYAILSTITNSYIGKATLSNSWGLIASQTTYV